MATPLIIKVLRLPPALNTQVDAYAKAHDLSWTAATLILLRAALEIAMRPKDPVPTNSSKRSQ